MLNSRIFLRCSIFIVSMLIMLNPDQDQEPLKESNTLSSRDLVILYAKTRMELAQIEYDWANQRPEGAISKPKIERFRTDLAVAREQYDQANLASSGGAEKVRLSHAEEKVRLARLERDTANKILHGHTANKFRRERAELRYKLSQLKLAMLKNPENYVTLIEAMQAQIDHLSQELLSLDLRVTRLETNH